MGITQYKKVATPLSFWGITSTHHSALSNEEGNFVLAQGAEKYSAKVEMYIFRIWWLMMFEPLELKTNLYTSSKSAGVWYQCL